jgi:hypothetical protein
MKQKRGNISGLCRDCGHRTYFRRVALNRVKQPRCAQCGWFLDLVPHVQNETALARSMRAGAHAADETNIPRCKVPLVTPGVCVRCGHRMSREATRIVVMCFLCRRKQLNDPA